MVEVADPPRVERRNRKPALPMLNQQAAPLQRLQGVADGLARDAEHLRCALLRKPVPGRQRAIHDGVDQPVLDLLDQNRLNVELSESHGH